MPDFYVLYFEGLFFLGTSLREFKENVSYFINLTLMIVNLEVESRELLSPLDLFGAQVLCIYELL